MQSTISITADDVQRIIDTQIPSNHSPVLSFEEKKNKSYSYTPHVNSYHIHLSSNSSVTYVLMVAHPPPPQPTFLHPNLSVLANIHTSISSQTSIPIPTLHALDTTVSIIPYHYLLLSQPSGLTTIVEARRDGTLSGKDDARIDLQLGVYLRQLHDIQNDWFGVPRPGGDEPVDPSYNWQESFTLLLEQALHNAKTELKIELGYEEIRGYLSRAIGCYMFDDVEVPSLVWFSGSENDVLVSPPSLPSSSGPEIQIVSLTFTQAIWGDPLLESFFLPPGPSRAVLEGYEKQLIVFPRQRTKRIWYTVFLALTILLQGGQEKRDWANETLVKCVGDLKEAPCY